MEEFEANSILDSRFRRRKLEYYVDWVGYDVSNYSWEPTVVLTNANGESKIFTTDFYLVPVHTWPPLDGGNLLGPTLYSH